MREGQSLWRDTISKFQKTLILAFEANMLSFHIIVPFFGFQPTVLPNIWYSGTRATSFFSKVLHKRRKFLEIWTFWGLFLPTSWKALMLAAFVSYDIAVLFRNKRFILNLMPQRNASKFAKKTFPYLYLFLLEQNLENK